MTRLIATRGLPGSGKSTWAEKYVLDHEAGTVVRVNRDSLRDMLHAGRWKGNKTEDFTKTIRNEIIRAGLRAGKTVIVDDTNLSHKTTAELYSLAAIAEFYPCKFEIQDFTDVPLETCIKRDLERPKSVGEKVIRRMYRDFLAPKQETYSPDPKLPHVIICDIDGTLAIKGDRDIYDYSRVEVDKPNLPIVRLVQSFGECLEIIYMSGRDDSCYLSTRYWIADHLGYAFPEDIQLFMRKTGDKRKDSIVKRELFDEFIRDKYQVDYVIDDRDSVVEMWRSLGLTCLQVNEGDF